MSKNYIIKGKMKLKFEWKKFTKTVTAEDDKSAKDKAMSILGGNHGLKRFEVNIESVTEELVKAP